MNTPTTNRQPKESIVGCKRVRRENLVATYFLLKLPPSLGGGFAVRACLKKERHTVFCGKDFGTALKFWVMAAKGFVTPVTLEEIWLDFAPEEKI